MTDAEVGKLWKANKIPTVDRDKLHDLQADLINDLILKLIEERVNRLEGGYTYMTGRGTHAEQEACADFCISYESYLAAKEKG